jgi:DNA-binding response OmpR family regulator
VSCDDGVVSRACIAMDYAAGGVDFDDSRVDRGDRRAAARLETVPMLDRAFYGRQPSAQVATRVLVVDDSPTIRKVVGGILERHGFESVGAADGHIALETLSKPDEKFDLVLVDFVMPRMNGFQFCRALRSRDEHRTLPVVLMSAKSDKIREQFVQQTGAIDAITKPFDAQALVAVIENAIKRAASWRARGDALAAGIPDEFEPVDSVKPPPVTDSDSRRAKIALEAARAIAIAIAPALAKLPSSALGNDAQIAIELVSNLTHDNLRGLVEGMRAVDITPGPKVALAGDIAIIPIGAVLQLLQIENQTGVLSVTSGPSEASMALRNGLIDLVQARGAGQEFRLGRYFVETGVLAREDIDRILQDSLAQSGENGATDRNFSRREETTGMRNVRVLGEVLVDSGKISPEQLREALARQSSELIYEVLRWQKGRFEFRRSPLPPLATQAKLGLPVASVVMEGFRRVDEWRLIEERLGSFDSVPKPDTMAIEALGADRLARAERGVLESVDGERTVREIVTTSNMSSFDACKILYQLLEARLVRRGAA